MEPHNCDIHTLSDLEMKQKRCTVCNKLTNRLTNLTLPCFVTALEHSQLFTAIYPVTRRNTAALVVFTDLAKTSFSVTLCDDYPQHKSSCAERARALMLTSDHATIAKNCNKDILANFIKQIIDIRWEKYNYKLARKALSLSQNTTIKLLSQAVCETPTFSTTRDLLPTNLFTLLPQEIIYIIKEKLIQAEESLLATKIQTIYKRWKQRFWHPSRYWRDTSGITLKKAKADNLWTICEDCGTRRAVNQIIIIQACAGHDQCWKIVCSEYCIYKCESSTNSGCGNHLYIKQLDKLNNGEPTYWQCKHCLNNITLNEKWWGISEAAYANRLIH